MEVQIEGTGALSELGEVVGSNCYWGSHGMGETRMGRIVSHDHNEVPEEAILSLCLLLGAQPQRPVRE